MGFANYIFNFLGACARWIWGQLRYKVIGGQKFTFKEYLNGPKNGDEIIDTWGHGLINNIIGVVVLLCLIFLSRYFVLKAYE